MRRNDVLCVVSLVACVLVISGCGRGGNAEPTPTFVPTPIIPESPEYAVQRGDVVREVEFMGRVTPAQMKTLFFETDGRVRNVYVTRDQEVTEGTVLAELDIEDLLSELEQARVSLQTAQNMLNTELRNHDRSRRLAEINLRTAEAQLAMVQVQDPKAEVTIAQVSLERAAAALGQAEVEYDKAVNRPWEGPDALKWHEAMLQEAQWDHREAQALHDQAVAQRQAHQYQLTVLSHDVERAQLELEWLDVGVDPVLTQTVQAAQLVVDGLQAQVDRARIVAPFDGRVLSIALSEGSQIQAFRPAITLAGGDELEVTGKPSEREVRDIAVGMPCALERSGAPGDLISGEVAALPRTTGAVEDRDPEVHVRILGAEGLGLEVNDPVQVRIMVEERNGVLWLPPQAIRTYEGRRFVVVREGDDRRRVDVRLGLIGKERVEILEGLEQGQIVVAP